MSIEKQLYPKTKRVSSKEKPIVITEKLDGSNLGIFKLDDKLLVGSRNRIFTYPDEPVDSIKGLQNWLDSYSLELHDGSGIFVEFLGQGKLKYPDFSNKAYMFAKANIDKDLTVSNINYTHEHFIYSFQDQVVPDFISVVPVVTTMNSYPTIDDLNKLYQKYSEQQKRDVEGFVVNQGNVIRKYVRMKNGKLSNHHE